MTHLRAEKVRLEPRVELVERIKQMKAERKRYFDVEGDGVDVLLNDLWDFLDHETKATRSDEARQALATIRDTDEDAEWLHRVADNKNALVRVHEKARENLHRLANRLASSTPAEPDEPSALIDEEDELHPLTLAEIEEEQFDAAIKSAFRMGARGCREMMARFVETGPATDPKVLAGSIRANWNPLWGDDLGPPDEYPVELGALEGRIDAKKFAASAVEHAMSLLSQRKAKQS